MPDGGERGECRITSCCPPVWLFRYGPFRAGPGNHEHRLRATRRSPPSGQQCPNRSTPRARIASNVGDDPIGIVSRGRAPIIAAIISETPKKESNRHVGSTRNGRLPVSGG